MRAQGHLSSRSLVIALSFVCTVSSGFTWYTRELSIVGPDFFEEFNWESKNDPTHGRVNYLSLEEARAGNLSYGSLPFLSCYFIDNVLTGAINHQGQVFHVTGFQERRQPGVSR